MGEFSVFFHIINSEKKLRFSVYLHNSAHVELEQALHPWRLQGPVPEVDWSTQGYEELMPPLWK